VGISPWTPSLILSGVVQNAGTLTVSGGGILQLSGASTFAGGYNVAANSGLLIAANSTPSTPGAVVTAGPLGTGTLTLQSGDAAFQRRVRSCQCCPLQAPSILRGSTR
jgi:autotransporter-associated beta strand protein